MKLLPRYATVCGLQPRRQWLLESFYPLPITKYITLHAGSGMLAKNYPLFQEVIAMLLHILESQGIKIVQLGGKDETLINGCIDLRSKTDYHQSAYILRNSLLHLGNDSWLMHRAGDIKIPIVELFGPTSVENHSPYHYDPAKTIFIESHRLGKRPTFAAQEMPMTIAFIPPEVVCNAVLRLLGITEGLFSQTTLSIGALYAHPMLELIPNVVPPATFLPALPITVRMDHLFSEDNLVALLQTGRKVNIITRRAIQLPLLNQFRASILTYAHEIVVGVDEPAIGYVDAIRSLFSTGHAFFTRETDERKVSDLRFTYLDHVTVSVHRDATKTDFVSGALAYLNRPDTPENRLDIERQLGQSRLKTNRLLMSDNHIYPTYAHLAANKPLATLSDTVVDLIDDPTTWRDSQHLLAYHQPT